MSVVWARVPGPVERSSVRLMACASYLGPCCGCEFAPVCLLISCSVPWLSSAPSACLPVHLLPTCQCTGVTLQTQV